MRFSSPGFSNLIMPCLSKNSNISIYENHIIVDLIVRANKCVGAYVYDEKQNQVVTFRSKIIVLATGGASRVYLYTSNPAVASGDGIAVGCGGSQGQYPRTCGSQAVA